MDSFSEGFLKTAAKHGYNEEAANILLKIAEVSRQADADPNFRAGLLGQLEKLSAPGDMYQAARDVEALRANRPARRPRRSPARPAAPEGSTALVPYDRGGAVARQSSSAVVPYDRGGAVAPVGRGGAVSPTQPNFIPSRQVTQDRGLQQLISDLRGDSATGASRGPVRGDRVRYPSAASPAAGAAAKGGLLRGLKKGLIRGAKGAGRHPIGAGLAALGTAAVVAPQLWRTGRRMWEGDLGSQRWFRNATPEQRRRYEDAQAQAKWYQENYAGTGETPRQGLRLFHGSERTDLTNPGSHYYRPNAVSPGAHADYLRSIGREPSKQPVPGMKRQPSSTTSSHFDADIWRRGHEDQAREQMTPADWARFQEMKRVQREREEFLRRYGNPPESRMRTRAARLAADNRGVAR